MEKLTRHILEAVLNSNSDQGAAKAAADVALDLAKAAWNTAMLRADGSSFKDWIKELNDTSLRTAEEWMALEEHHGILVVDPAGGWGEDFMKPWHEEKITRAELNRRLKLSKTIRI